MAALAGFQRHPPVSHLPERQARAHGQGQGWPGRARPAAADEVPPARRQAPLVRAGIRLRGQQAHEPHVCRFALEQEQRALREAAPRRPSASAPARTACTRRPEAGRCRGRRLPEALELHLADRLELEVGALPTASTTGGQHLARMRARHDPRGEVHVATEVVTVAVHGAPVVDADPWASNGARNPPGTRLPSPSGRPGRSPRSSRRHRCS